MTPNTQISRRTALKGIGGVAGAAAVGGMAFLATGPAAAATQDYGSVSITSDDGSVEYVAIYGDSKVEWDGFDTAAASFAIDIDAKLASQSSWTNLHETGMVALDDDTWGNDEALSGPGTSGTIETAIGLAGDGTHDPTTDWHIVGSDPDGYGLPANSIDPAALSVDTDGDSATYTVEVRAVYTWYDASDVEIFSKTFTAPVDVTVNNEPAEATGSSTTSGATGA